MLYLDPAANLAGKMICENKFSDANRLLHSAFGWWKEHSGSFLDLINYPEFGWWYLYHGRFQDAYQHISAMYRFRTPDEVSLLWITLAAWLSGNFEEYAQQLAGFYISLENPSLLTAKGASVVATSCPEALGDELRNHCTRGHEIELFDIAKGLGMWPHSFERPLEDWVCRTVIRSADSRFTGGKYSELIG